MQSLVSSETEMLVCTADVSASKAFWLWNVPFFCIWHWWIYIIIANTLWAKTAFTRSDINTPKVNRFGWNLEHCEPNVKGWIWQIFDAIPQ